MCGALAFVLLTGCGSTVKTTELRPSDFEVERDPSEQSAPLAATNDSTSLSIESVASAEAPVSRIPVTAQPDSAPDDLLVIAGPPERSLGASDEAPAARPSAPEGPRPSQRTTSSSAKRLQVDQMVGQVNGRPVFASEFLEPMDARFEREAERLNREEWLEMARKDIQQALVSDLYDELLLAEFESSLTPEQKMGVLAFIDEVRDDLISGNLGSREVANRRFLEAEGLDLDAKVEDVTQRQFILAQLRKAIGDRVHVGFVDVQRYYEKNRDEFMPPPEARFRIIRVRASAEDAIREIETALNEGRDFAELAAQYSTYARDKENLHEVTLESRNYSASMLFGPEELNSAVQGLEPGGRTPGVDVGASRYWIKLEEIHQPAGQTLYEAQAAIERHLRAERLAEEEERYRAQLFMRGNYSSIEQMVEDLLAFAEERYLIQRPAFRAIGSASP